MASPVIKAGSPGYHTIEEYTVPLHVWPTIGLKPEDERLAHNGHIVVLRPISHPTVGSQQYAIVRPDGELALAFERELALEIAADYFSHGQL